MKDYLFYLCGVSLLLSLAACNPTTSQLPQDFELNLDWNTGALPPQYRYEYRIHIDAQGSGTFYYHPGYEETAANDWQAEFSLSHKQIEELYRYLQDNNLLRGDWEMGQPLMGGKGTGLHIIVAGEEFMIPSVSELSQADRETVNQAIDTINNLIPDDIWNEMKVRQADYESSF